MLNSAEVDAEMNAEATGGRVLLQVGKPVLRYGATFGGLGLLWQLMLAAGLADGRILGTPATLLDSLGQSLSTSGTYTQILGTLLAILASFAIGTAVGILLALLFGYVPLLAAACQPIVSALNSLPRVALAPLFVLWFGLGFKSSVAVAVSMVSIFTLITVYAGLLSISKEVVTSARVAGASGRQLFTGVYLPGVAQWIVTTLELNVGFCFVGVILGQYLGSSSGLGYMIVSATAVGDIGRMEALLVITLAIAAVAIGGIRIARKRLIRWE